jgi:hypothetical protein
VNVIARADSKAVDFTSLYPRLTERDLEIVDALAVHKILTTSMIAAIWFPSEWTARKRILNLTELSVLARFRPGHRAAYRYTLGEWGHVIWAHRNAEKPPTRQWCAWQTQRLAVSRHRAHLEAVNAFASRLFADAHLSGNAYTVAQWLSESEAAEACSGQLRPDAGYVLKWRSGPQLRAWHEHDQGTETHTQLIAKLRRYARFRPLDGGRSRTVLFTLPSRAREQHFHTGAAREALEFPVATAVTGAIGSRPAGAHWQLVGSGRRLTLAEIAQRTDAL